MFNVSVKLPNMFVNGQYTLDMKVLVLRISGQGDFDLNLGECYKQHRHICREQLASCDFFQTIQLPT